MKNIYIIGIPRSGKTTLAHLLKEKTNYNLLSFEAIRNGFIKSLPELNMGNRNSNARKEILPGFIVEFANWNYEITGCSNIIEGSFTDIKTISSLIDDNDVVICLGFGGIDLEQYVKLVKEYETERDYTKTWSVDDMKNHFYDSNVEDIANIKQCKEYNVMYFDTSINRTEVLANIIDYLEKMNLKQISM